MKRKASLVVLVMSLMICGSAGAWGLPSIPGIGGGSSAGDPDAFLAKAKASELLVNKSADQLFCLIASKEEQARVEEQRQKINATSDEKEKDALTRDLASSECATINKAAADKNLQAEAKNWDAKKKKLAAASLFNLALGGKMAADLVPQGQQMAGAIKSNPLLLTKVGSLLEAVKSLGGITVGTAKVMTSIPPLFSAADIQVKLPTSSAEVATATDALN